MVRFFVIQVPRIALPGTAKSVVTTFDPQGRQISCITVRDPLSYESHGVCISISSFLHLLLKCVVIASSKLWTVSVLKQA